jgi:hypothetical protein
MDTPAPHAEAFECVWADSAETGVAAGSIVEDLDAVEDIGAGELAVL